MKSFSARVGLAGALLFWSGGASLVSGCGASPRKPAATPASAAAEPASPATAVRPPAHGPSLDRQGCDPSGKAFVVVVKDGEGRVNRWRYFSTVRRGAGVARVLKCEAADSNGDGYVDARYFYDGKGRLLLEQRDLDFDGRAEVIADYSHFSTGHLKSARHLD